MQLSYWERETYFENIDLLIVGSGIVGLNSARAIKEKHPDWKVLVIDRGFLPYGASTRNAGFACYGSLSELIDDNATMGETALYNLVKKRWDGLNRLRSVLGDAKIGYEPYGGYEIFRKEELEVYQNCCDNLTFYNKMLEDITGEKLMYENADAKIQGFGFSGVEHLICNRGEGQIDTGMMMNSLLNYVRDLGVQIVNSVSINSWRKNHDDTISVETNHDFSFTTNRILFTTNAFAKQLLPELDVVPGRAQVLITKPIENLKVKGSFHLDKGYYYFRNVGDRVLFGGGRNLNFEGEKTYEFGLTAQIQETLESILKTVILPNQKFEIDQRWSGIMGLGPVKSSIVKEISNNVYCAVRMGGMGIAIGSLIGEEAAEICG